MAIRTRSIAAAGGARRHEVAAVIDAEEFEAAHRDPLVYKFAKAAKAYRAKLRRESRDG